MAQFSFGPQQTYGPDAYQPYGGYDPYAGAGVGAGNMGGPSWLGAFLEQYLRGLGMQDTAVGPSASPNTGGMMPDMWPSYAPPGISPWGSANEDDIVGRLLQQLLGQPQP